MSGKVLVRSHINGEDVEFLCEPRQSLLEVLRDVLGLTGSKEGCNNGNCGACNVIMNGVLVNSCLVLAVEADGSAITTIEALPCRRTAPLQQAFLNRLRCSAASARRASSHRRRPC
jgi:carbon-monoxide dehydrogenase small subunit